MYIHLTARPQKNRSYSDTDLPISRYDSEFRYIGELGLFVETRQRSRIKGTNSQFRSLKSTADASLQRDLPYFILPELSLI